MAREEVHRALVGEIQRLMLVYDTLSPEVKKEILRFLKSPEIITNVNLHKIQRLKSSNPNNQLISYYIV